MTWKYFWHIAMFWALAAAAYQDGRCGTALLTAIGGPAWIMIGLILTKDQDQDA